MGSWPSSQVERIYQKIFLMQKTMNKYFTNKEFRNGFDAAALCEPCDKTKSADWVAGWMHYQDKMDASETANYY